MDGVVGILGAGLSGMAAARLAHRQGDTGWCADIREPSPDRRRALDALGFSWRESPPDEAAGRVVLSPGFAMDHPWVRSCRAAGARLEPEFEMGARHLEGPILAITGSLGKTTMAEVAADLLRASGRRVTVSGNIGIPVSDVALASPVADVHVMELSSFQLEEMTDFAPAAAVCLNLVPNHLDRHGDLETYAAAKARLFRNMEAGDVAVWPEDFPVEVVTGGTQRDPLKEARPSWRGTRFESGALSENLRRLWPALERVGTPPPEAEARVLAAFAPPPHRHQVLKIPGAGRVVDDSKSTCLTATRAALETEGAETHLIAGGLGKGEDAEFLRETLLSLGVSVYLIGAAAGEFMHAWRGAAAHCEVCETLERAVERVWERRDESQPLLFSPGCASFDQFTDFASRGDEFQRLVSEQAARQPVKTI